MKLQFFSQSSKLVRLALTGLIATQAAIATTVISEFALTTPGIDSTHAALAKNDQLSAQDVYRKASPAVVYVEAEGDNERFSGSGVIIDANGLIVTNAHVVEGARQVTVELADGRKFSAKVVSEGDPDCLDLALLKIQATKLPTVSFAAANSVRKGQDAFAIGYPKGVKPSSITRGGISNVFSDRGEIQTDTTLNHGNSGGALLNDRGELVGINTRGETDAAQMNTAIAADRVQALLQALKQGISPVIGQYLIPGNASADTPVAKPLSLIKPQQGQLKRSNSHMCVDGRRTDLYTFEGDVDQPIMLKMVSAEMGSFLAVIAPDGQLVAQTGGDRNRPVGIAVNLPQRGTYTIIATSTRPEQAGQYQLQASTPLLIEESRLTLSDARRLNGSAYRNYVFSGKAGQTIEIMLHEFEFDPFLAVVDPNGKVVAQGTAQRQDIVTVKLPQDGQYTLVVSTVKPGDRGKFFLSVHPSTETQPSQVSQNR